MKVSTLRQLFEIETHRQKASNVGFSVPLISEVDVGLDVDLDPLLATNMKGAFLQTRVSSSGSARFGYSEIPLEQEDRLLSELHKTLMTFMGVRPLEGARLTMEGKGYRPCTLVTPDPVVESEGLKVLHCSEVQSPILVANPGQTGLYTRVGQHLGVLIYKADVSFALVSL